MARTNKKAEEAAQKAQETQGAQETFQGTQDQETAPGSAQETTEDVQEPASGETRFTDYAVAGCAYLNLRQEPSLDAPIVTRLPRGIGVLGSDRPAENGWRQVFTGRLFGWVMDKYLEPLGSSHGAD